MSRVTPSGERLEWELSFPLDTDLGGVIPFFIDWGTSPHPASGCAGPARLGLLELRHPRPARVEQAVAALELTAAVWEGERPGLRAVIEGELGPVELY